MGPALQRFMMAFIDGRDGGLLLVSHFSLLLGMAAPVWLSASLLPHSSQQPGVLGKAAELLPEQCPVAQSLQGLWGGPVASMPYFAFAGIVMLGAGDSAASALGRCFGRVKILGTSKTVEGTFGGMAASMAAWGLIAISYSWVQERRVSLWSLGGGLSGGVSKHFGLSWGTVAGGVFASCMLEASTTQLDNIFLPLHHFAWLAA